MREAQAAAPAVVQVETPLRFSIVQVMWCLCRLSLAVCGSHSSLSLL